MERLGYYNGVYGPLEDMTVPMNDRVSWFGDGVYDAGPCRNYHIFALDEHVDRFFRSAEALQIRIPVSKEELKNTLNSLVHEMDTGNLFVYYQVTRGTGPRKHAFIDSPANLWITLTPAEISDGHVPIQLITTEDTRFFHCNIKTLNLLPSVMGSQKAFEAGAKEVIFHRGQRVTECAHTNVNILKDGVFITPPLDELILPGVTRRHYISICQKLGVPYEERVFTLDELFAADEIFITSAGTLGLPAYEIDGKKVGGKAPDLLKKLQKAAVEDFEIETGFKADII